MGNVNVNDINNGTSRSASAISWRPNEASMETIEILKKSGVNMGADNNEELSRKCLRLKNISPRIDTESIEIASRVHYGFMYIKSSFENQKRWFFVLASKPISDSGLLADEQILDESVLPSWLKLDTLYFFKVANDEDTSEALAIIPLA